MGHNLLVKHNDELASARADLAAISANLQKASRALDRINANPLLIARARVETTLDQAKENLKNSLGIVPAFRKLWKKLEQDPGAVPGVDAGALRVFIKDPALSACAMSLPPAQYISLIETGRCAIAAGRVPIKHSKREAILSLVGRAINGNELQDKISNVKQLLADTAKLARDPAIPRLLTEQANLARRVASFQEAERKARDRVTTAKANAIQATATARWYHRILARDRRAQSIKSAFILAIVVGGFLLGGWFVVSLLNAPLMDDRTPSDWHQDEGGGDGGGGGPCCLGQCTNETDCIYYRWGDYAVGILAVDAPYTAPHERVDPVPFQASLRVGGDMHSGGDYVLDFVRAPANRSLWLKSPFEYEGHVRNQYSVLGFVVPLSHTGNIYIQELLYDPARDQVWAIVWLDGSSWCLLKFPWI